MKAKRTAYGALALTDSQVEALTSSSHFNALRPWKCRACGSTGPFRRRVWQIQGVPPSQQRDNDVQGLLRHHFHEKHGVEFVFFKTHARAFYADSASCECCGSSQVAFDVVEMGGREQTELARLAGCDAEQMRGAVERMVAAMEEAEEQE